MKRVVQVFGMKTGRGTDPAMQSGNPGSVPVIPISFLKNEARRIGLNRCIVALTLFTCVTAWAWKTPYYLYNWIFGPFETAPALLATIPEVYVADPQGDSRFFQPYSETTFQVQPYWRDGWKYSREVEIAGAFSALSDTGMERWVLLKLPDSDKFLPARIQRGQTLESGTRLTGIIRGLPPYRESELRSSAAFREMWLQVPVSDLPSLPGRILPNYLDTVNPLNYSLLLEVPVSILLFVLSALYLVNALRSLFVPTASRVYRMQIIPREEGGRREMVKRIDDSLRPFLPRGLYQVAVFESDDFYVERETFRVKVSWKS